MFNSYLVDFDDGMHPANPFSLINDNQTEVGMETKHEVSLLENCFVFSYELFFITALVLF